MLKSPFTGLIDHIIRNIIKTGKCYFWEFQILKHFFLKFTQIKSQGMSSSYIYIYLYIHIYYHLWRTRIMYYSTQSWILDTWLYIQTRCNSAITLHSWFNLDYSNKHYLVNGILYSALWSVKICAFVLVHIHKNDYIDRISYFS